MDPTTFAPSVPELLDIWSAAIADTAALCDGLTDEQWLAQTPCPGWSVADVVAHTTDIESFMRGLPRPDHTPDWDSLPHASGPLNQFIEAGVDYRRGRAKADVLDELRTVADARRAELLALPEGAEVMGISGKQVPLERLVRVRTFDVWAHEQDIRTAVAMDGNWGSRSAIVAFQQMAAGLPFVWAKGVAAPIGATVRVSITGPELAAELFAITGEDGKGAVNGPVDDPTVHLTLTWPDYTRRSCGRIDAHDPAFRSRITVSGDSVLSEALLEKMAVTP